MNKSKMLIDMAESYKDALAGTDVISALKIHCEKAGISTQYLSFSGPEIYIIFNVLKLANGQKKLDNLLDVLAKDGINLTDAPDKASELPRLNITRCTSYIPTTGIIDDNRLKLLEGIIENRTNSIQHVILEASVQNTSDVIRKSLDVPVGGIAIPYLRLPKISIATQNY